MKLTKKNSIFKKIAAAMLAFALIFSLASCKDNTDPAKKYNADEIVEPANQKVAIIVAPETQYPEDFKAARALEKKYPNSIIIKTCEDTRILKGGDPDIITFSKELANDPEIGAIVYARATQYTRNAIYKAKEINPELVTICIEPEDDINELSERADIIYCIDWVKAAEDIVAQAKAQGAKYFVTFSFSRHISGNPLIRGEIDALKTACEAQGITYLYESCVDTNSAGIAGAQKYINEAIARLFMNKKIEGKDVALFSTDSAVQSTLIEQANDKELIYICPSFPTAYNGLGEVYKVEMPEDITDVKAYIKNVKAAVEADAEGKGRFSIIKTPLASILLEAAIHSAFDLLNGTMTTENMADKATVRALVAANSDDFSINAYGTKPNVYMAYQPGFETIR